MVAPFPGCSRTGCGAATGSNHAVKVPDIHPDTRDAVSTARTQGHATADDRHITASYRTPPNCGPRRWNLTRPGSFDGHHEPITEYFGPTNEEASHHQVRGFDCSIDGDVCGTATSPQLSFRN